MLFRSAKEFIIEKIRDIRKELEAKESAMNVLQLEYNKFELLKEFTIDHPNIIFIQKKTNETRRDLGMRGSEIPIPRTLSEASQFLEKTKRGLKVNEDMYNLLLEKEQEARLTEASEVGNVRVIDSAIIPDRPIRPRKMVNTLMGGIVGLIFGLGFAFLTEYMDKSIKSKEDIEKIVGRAIDKNDVGNFGLVMRTVMEEVAGRADAKEVSEIIKEQLDSLG